MKRVLIVKMSSMGDVIHTLPALSDCIKVNPDVRFDWVVEPAFQEIPKWHKAVDTVIPFSLRAFRKQPLQFLKDKKWQNFLEILQAKHYDLIIDAQGLIKSAVIGKMANGEMAGYDKQSAREKWASYFYSQKISVSKNQHAVARIRELFAKIFGYPIPNDYPDYGILQSALKPVDLAKLNIHSPYVLFFHGTTWDTKHYPENFWKELIVHAAQDGYQVLLPWGNAIEEARARRLAQTSEGCVVLPKLGLSELASIIQQAKGVVAVDTGLSHVSAGLNVLTVSLYGPTDPFKTGAYGKNQIHLKADFQCAPCLRKQCLFKKEELKNTEFPPCFATLPPTQVWERIKRS